MKSKYFLEYNNALLQNTMDSIFSYLLTILCFSLFYNIFSLLSLLQSPGDGDIELGSSVLINSCTVSGEGVRTVQIGVQYCLKYSSETQGNAKH